MVKLADKYKTAIRSNTPPCDAVRAGITVSDNELQRENILKSEPAIVWLFREMYSAETPAWELITSCVHI